ncbi:hypothetical protein CG419_01430 [Latilactobacillus curvatus]|uniref:Uncharacterized protein n=1 Tax=Latilactobacillus curvatus TaxID=28038 RepID=A0AAC9UMJ2_LATCU|nr:hypothetical protein [Latilactobacillus curvatus]ASN59367.1 hypothetical protein CG419_01430 [Latilactobacillus curvatus]
MDKRKLNPQLLKDTPSGFSQFKIIALVVFVTLGILNIWLRYHYHFSISKYRDTPNSLTFFDYCLITLLIITGIFYALEKLTNFYIYYRCMLYSFNLFGILFIISNAWPSLSWINYGWQFPLHDYFLPLVTLDNIWLEVQYIALGLYINADAIFYRGLEKKGLF